MTAVSASRYRSTRKIERDDEPGRRSLPEARRVERVIIDLKQELRAAGVVDRYARPEEHAVAESVIRWCIERYYGSAPRDD